ncbi:MAG: aminoacyl-histidine dipeptidase, partial [Anaerorhabdus sp.]
TYKDMTGNEMEKVAAHGGNECGILESILDNPNIANLGPCMKYIHTPQETLQLESFDRMYDVLVNVIKKL